MKQLSQITNPEQWDTGMRNTFKSRIMSIVVVSLQAALQRCQLNTFDATLAHQAHLILSIDVPPGADFIMTQEVAESAQALSKVAAVRSAHRQVCGEGPHLWGLSTAKFLDDIDRLVSPSYVPSMEDSVWAWSKTTGIVEHTFSVQQTKIVFVEPGGARNERKKWPHAFSPGVVATVYLASLSDYSKM